MNRKIITSLALLAGLVTAIPTITMAQTNPGLTIFSGVDRENILNYHLDFGGQANGWDRYRLRLPRKKMTQGASKFIIKYPDYYDGVFDPDKIEVRVKDESMPLREVIWDEESYLLEIALEEPITEATKVEIILSNVKNPRWGGTYYFNADVLGADEFPVRIYLGTWIISIGGD